MHCLLRRATGEEIRENFLQLRRFHEIFYLDSKFSEYTPQFQENLMITYKQRETEKETSKTFAIPH